MQLVTPFSHSSERFGPSPGGVWSVIMAWWLTAFTLMAATESVRVSWAPNSEKDLAGYEVRYGSRRDIQVLKIEDRNTTEVVIPGIDGSAVNAFAVRAYNIYGLRGAYSEEAYYGAPDPQVPPEGRITSPATNGEIQAGRTVTFSASGSDSNNGDTLSYRWNFGGNSGIPDFIGRVPGEVRFSRPGVYQVTLTVTDSSGNVDATPETRTIRVQPDWNLVPQAGWRLKYVDSEEPAGFSANESFDGNPSTFWHTRWSTSKPTPPPHQIQIDLGEKHYIRGFQYLPRQDGISVGTISGFKFYVSMDGKNWGKEVAKGKFATGTREKRVFGKPKFGRFIKLVGVSEQNGHSDCSVAELNVIEGPPPNRAPVAKARTASTTRNTAVSFKLSAADADNNPLTYQIVSRPAKGTLSGSAPNLTYQPKDGFTGTDQFTFRVSDGSARSKTATVRITVARGAAAAKSAPILLAAKSPETTRATQGRITVDGRTYLTLTIEKPAIPDGLKRRVEVSPNLVDWFSGHEHTTVVLETNRRLTVRDNTPITPGKKRHIRVRTTGK